MLNYKYLCPKCGKNKGVPIVYGNCSKDDYDLAIRNEIILGGLCLGFPIPSLVNVCCVDCNHRWYDDSFGYGGDHNYKMKLYEPHQLYYNGDTYIIINVIGGLLATPENVGVKVIPDYSSHKKYIITYEIIDNKLFVATINSPTGFIPINPEDPSSKSYDGVYIITPNKQYDYDGTLTVKRYQIGDKVKRMCQPQTDILLDINIADGHVLSIINRSKIISKYIIENKNVDIDAIMKDTINNAYIMIEKAAKSHDEKLINYYTEIIKMCKNKLSIDTETIPGKIKWIEKQFNNTEANVAKTMNESGNNKKTINKIDGTRSAHIRGIIIDKLKEIGVRLDKISSTKYKLIKTSKYNDKLQVKSLVGMPVASERDNRWFLGLDGSKYEIYILVCDTANHNVNYIILPKEFVIEYSQYMPRDKRDNIKFNVERKLGDWYLRIPSKGNIVVTQYIDNYNAFT